LDPLSAEQVLEWTGRGHNACKSGSLGGGERFEVVIWDVTPCGLASVTMVTASTSATLNSGKNFPVREVKLI